MKIIELPTKNNILDSDYLIIDDNNISYKITAQQLYDYITETLLNNTATKDLSNVESLAVSFQTLLTDLFAKKDFSNVAVLSTSVKNTLGLMSRNLDNPLRATQTNIDGLMPEAMDYIIESNEIISTAADNTNGLAISWYEKYKSGKLIKGGLSGRVSAGATISIIFDATVPFIAKPYWADFTLFDASPHQNNSSIVNNMIAAGMSVYVGSDANVFWQAKGRWK